MCIKTNKICFNRSVDIKATKNLLPVMKKESGLIQYQEKGVFTSLNLGRKEGRKEGKRAKRLEIKCYCRF